MTLTTRMFFDIGALLVNEEVLGSSVSISFSDLTFILRVPLHDDSFNFSDVPAWRIHAFGSHAGGVGETSTALYTKTSFGPAQITQAPKGRTVAVLAADVVLPEAHALSNGSNAPDPSDRLAHYHEAVGRAVAVGTHLVQEAIAWLRVETRQHWLPATESRVVPLRPVILLGDDGEPRDDATWHVAGAVVIPSADMALSLEQLEEIAQHLRDNDCAPHPEQLIADAQYFAAFGSERDCARATLFSAMACETKIKVALTSRAIEANQELVEVILDHRSLPVAVHELFDRPSAAVLGHSLRRVNKQLYIDVQRLFTARNSFVHRLTFPTREDTRTYVATATAALDWVDSCVSS